MARILRSAADGGVRVGAHPGAVGQFGRANFDGSGEDLALLILHQVGALHRIAQKQRHRLHHLKLHGSLYHRTEQDRGFAQAYIDTVRRWWPELRIYCLAGGRVAALARVAGLSVWEEAFLDRAYEDDGQLLARSDSRALLNSKAQVRTRIRDLAGGRGIQAVSGRTVLLRPRTLCVHGDTAGAVGLARVAAEELKRLGCFDLRKATSPK